jgi:hypothetical protein
MQRLAHNTSPRVQTLSGTYGSVQLAADREHVVLAVTGRHWNVDGVLETDSAYVVVSPGEARSIAAATVRAADAAESVEPRQALLWSASVTKIGRGFGRRRAAAAAVALLLGITAVPAADAQDGPWFIQVGHKCQVTTLTPDQVASKLRDAYGTVTAVNVTDPINHRLFAVEFRNNYGPFTVMFHDRRDCERHARQVEPERKELPAEPHRTLGDGNGGRE